MRINVPYNRAGTSYLELLPRVAQGLLRVFAILPNALPSQTSLEDKKVPFAMENSTSSHDRPPSCGIDPLGLLRRFLTQLSQTGRPIMSTERPANAAPKTHDVQTAVDLINGLLKPLPGVNPMVWHSAEESLAKISRTASSPPAGPSSTSSTVGEVLEEAFDALPMQCTRLLLCAQSGWLLPPPASLQKFLKPSATEAHKENHSHPITMTPHTTNNPTHLTPNPSYGGLHEEDKPPPEGFTPPPPEATPAELRLFQRLHRDGVCNHAHSNLSEGVLLTLPAAIPRLHREVEQELEKYLWEDPAALMGDAPPAQSLTAEIRIAYSQNIVLTRLLSKLANLEDTITRLHADAQLALRRVRGDQNSGP
ncbi:unnamed protein product [Phytomonas sp. Hart1]|nr:unnamed protein product [Phytomonas sp. Hart1]|eukprot:CCW67892.1 unnamed protein product [Phytomonas sp. isolate Hart1]